MAIEPTPVKRPPIYRTRFFIAALWASLAPVALLALGCLVITLMPEGNKTIDPLRRAAGIALILVPFFYTGLVITAYGVVRLLHLINLLSRIALVIANGILSAAAAGLVAWANRALQLVSVNNALLFWGTLVAGLLALSVSALVWWRVASRLPPPPVPKKKSRRSHSPRQKPVEPEEV